MTLPIAILANFLLLGISGVEAAPPQTGRTFVAVIGADRFPKHPEINLNCCSKDARGVLDRLVNQNRLIQNKSLCLLEMLQDGDFANLLPTATNIRRELPAFLAKPGPEDTVILFAAMHGLRLPDPQGQLQGYLVPSDVDGRSRERLAETLISLNWLKTELQKTNAKSVILFLDACHAGAVGSTGVSHLAEKAEGAPLKTRDIEKLFGQAESQTAEVKQNIYTIVACKDDESSIEWSVFNHGVFAYWLCQGLDGAADTNGDAMVTMDELFSFVEMQVPLTAENLTLPNGGRGKQTPQRFFLGSDQGNLRPFPLHPEPAKSALHRLTGLIDAVLRNHSSRLSDSPQGPRISILEFAAKTPDQVSQTQLRGPLGSLGAVTRELVERELTHQSTRKDAAYRVVSAEALRLRDITLEEVKVGKLPANSKANGGQEVDALVLGAFHRISGAPGNGADRLIVEVELFDPRSTEKLGRISVTILVDEELWSLLGGSFDAMQSSPMTGQATASTKPATSTSIAEIAPAAGGPISVAASQIEAQKQIQSWNQTAHKKHPLHDAEQCTLSVGIKTGAPDQVKQLVQWSPNNPIDPNSLAFAVTKGDELEIVMENKTKSWLSVIVMVDGQNAIGRQRTLPSDAPYWHMPPGSRGVVDQWLQTPAPRQGGDAPKELTQILSGRKFQVTAPPDSVAAQQGLTDQLGEIRLLVFENKLLPSQQISRSADTIPGIGIGEGREERKVYQRYDERQIDLEKPLAAYVIHYVEATGKPSPSP